MHTPAAISPRTLRPANGALYLAMALCVCAAAAYAIISGRVQGWLPCTLATLGGIISLLWGGYYACLRYVADARALTRCSLFGRESRPWSTLRHAEFHEEDSRGIASCSILLTFEGGTWRISSDVLDPDAVQNLKNDLAAAGVFAPLA